MGTLVHHNECTAPTSHSYLQRAVINGYLQSPHLHAGRTVIGSATVSRDASRIEIILDHPPAPPVPGTQQTQDELARVSQWQSDSALAFVHVLRSTQPDAPDWVWIRALRGLLTVNQDISDDELGRLWRQSCHSRVLGAPGIAGTVADEQAGPPDSGDSATDTGTGG